MDGHWLEIKEDRYMAQYEHRIVVTDGEPPVLTESNRIFE
ncbi:hypothetical protein POKO110462_13435 [Pontibacter korlensis]